MLLKFLDFGVFEDEVEVSENQNDEIEKYICVNVGHFNLNDLPAL
jgi:hypothetical protein